MKIQQFRHTTAVRVPAADNQLDEGIFAQKAAAEKAAAQAAAHAASEKAKEDADKAGPAEEEKTTAEPAGEAEAQKKKRGSTGKRAPRGLAKGSFPWIAKALQEKGLRISDGTIKNYVADYLEANEQLVQDELNRLGLPDNIVNRTTIAAGLALRSRAEYVRTVMTPRLPSGEVNRSYINGINPFKGYPGDEAAQRAQGAAAMEQVAEILEKTYEDDDSKIRFMKSFLRFVKEGATSVYRQRLDGASQDAKANIWAQDNENHLTMANEGGLAVAYTTYFPAFAELASRRAAEYIGILGLSVLEFVASDEEIPVLTLTGNLKEDVKEILRTYMLDIDPVIFTRVWARFNEFLQMLFDEAGKPDEAAKQFKKWRAEHPDAPEDEFAVVGHGAHARWHRREDQLLARRKAVAVGIGKISEPNRKARLRELQVKLTRDIVKLNKSRKKILRGRIIYTLIEDVRQIIKRQVYRAFTFPVIMSSISNEDLEQFAKDLGISLQDAAKGYNTQRAQVLRGKTGIDAMKGEDWNPDLIDPLEILKKALKDSDGKNSNDAVPNSEDDDPAERAAKEEKKEFVQEKFKALAKKLGYSTDKEVTMKESDALASYLKKNYGIELTGIHKLDVALLKMADEIEKLKEIKSSKWMTNSHPIFKGSDDEKVPDFDPRETPGLALIPGVDKEGERYTYFTRVRKSVLAHAEYALGIIEELIDFSSSNDDTSALEEMRNDIIAKVIRKEVGARRGQKIGESTTYDRSCTSGFGSWTKARF